MTGWRSRSGAGRRLVALVAVAVGLSAGVARAQAPSGEGARGLAAPTFREPREGARGLATPELGAPTPAEAAAEGWRGPRVELTYAHYRIGDGYDGGGVHALQFGGYLPTGPARLGLYGELALRDYSLGPSSDAIVRGAVVAGYQQLEGLGPVVPYVVGVGTVGVMFGKRFHSTVSETMWGAGLEFGADVNLVRNLWTGLGFSWIRITMRDLRWDLLMVRLSIGL